MSTNQTLRGTSSYKVERVTPELFKAHSGQFLFMLQDYFKRSSDKSSDPVSTFNRVCERIAGDDKFMMVAPVKDNIPIGFMASEVNGDVARIVMGYVQNNVKSDIKNNIIDVSLDMFDAWSRLHKCKIQKFFAHRAPGAHKMMLTRGWEYELAIYKKEIL